MFKILVVEDDRDLNRSVCSYLNNNGYESVGCLGAEDFALLRRVKAGYGVWIFEKEEE